MVFPPTRRARGPPSGGPTGADTLGAATPGTDPTAEDLDVQPRGGRGGRVPLDAQREPVLALCLDGLDDTVQGTGAGAQSSRHALDCSPVLAVDHHLALAVDGGQAR